MKNSNSNKSKKPTKFKTGFQQHQDRTIIRFRNGLRLEIVPAVDESTVEETSFLSTYKKAGVMVWYGNRRKCLTPEMACELFGESRKNKMAGALEINSTDLARVIRWCKQRNTIRAG